LRSSTADNPEIDEVDDVTPVPSALLGRREWTGGCDAGWMPAAIAAICVVARSLLIWWDGTNGSRVAKRVLQH